MYHIQHTYNPCFDPQISEEPQNPEKKEDFRKTDLSSKERTISYAVILSCRHLICTSNSSFFFW